MVQPVQNFTVDSVDSEGRRLIGSNHILDIVYYDATGETWRRDYSKLANPIVNPNFAAPTVTGTGPGGTPAPGSGWYETGTDAVNPPSVVKFIKLCKLPFDYTNELIATYGTVLANTTTVNGLAAGVSGDFFIEPDLFTAPKNNFPANYQLTGWDNTLDAWATTSGTLAGPHAIIAWTLNPPQEVAGFFLDSFDADETTINNSISGSLGNYQIQVGNTGTGLVDSDYTTIASGVVPLGWTTPIWIDVPPTTAKYVRIRWRNNGGTRSGMFKVFAYSKAVIDAGMSMAAYKVMGVPTANINNRTLEFNQTVDFTGIDRLYFDLKDYARFLTVPLQVSVAGNVKFTIPDSKLSAADDLFIYARGVSIDVSAHGGGSQLRFSKPFFNHTTSAVASSDYFSVTNFSVQPSWFSEAPSAKRGSQKAFPDKSLIVVDIKGISIIDISDPDVGPKLWMRFDMGFKKMVRQLPRKLVVRDGALYMATARGLFVIDFTDNRCVRFNEQGVWVRYGIHDRNENGYDVAEFAIGPTPARIQLNYFKLFNPAIPELYINDIAVGKDLVFGKYAVLATNKGLVVFNHKFDSTAAFFTSADTRPVSKVVISNNSIWYTQGEFDDEVVNYISSVNSAVANGFVPQKTYYKPVSYADPLSGPLDLDTWEVVTDDPSMALAEGDVLTISGSHQTSGTTGLISRQAFGDRSFSAKVKVRLLDFPPDARGAIRFGICRDYKHRGILSLEGVLTDDAPNGVRNNRSGFFLSAFNIDPYGWPAFGSDPFATPEFSPHWFYLARDNTNETNVSSSRFKAAVPTPSGVLIKAYTDWNASQSNSRLIRYGSVQPVLARDFTARLLVQQEQGFSPPTSTNQTLNSSLWFGITRRPYMIPGASPDTGNMVDAAMVVTGVTTFSGVSVYTVGKYGNTGSIGNSVMTQPRIAVGASENTGHTTSPYREWRLDYDHGLNTLNCFIDGVSVGSIASNDFTNPNNIGLCFGVSPRDGSDTVLHNQVAFFRDLRIEYPTLASGSRNKYGLEVSRTTGNIAPFFTNFTTYSGISRSGDTVPTSGTLTSLPALSDGDLSIGAISASQNLSFGVALSGTQTVEALYLYDASTATSGWNTTTAKRVEVWHSPDNVFWAKYKEYDLNCQERTSGLTRLRFSPAIADKFFKVRCLDAAYAVPGGAPWTLAEVRAMTASGTGFMAGDGTGDAEFREWRLDYDATTKEILGYIDGTLVSKGTMSAGVSDARFVLAHDLSVVSSGTDSTFHGEFKDFEVTFSGAGVVAAGEITAMAVNHTTLSGGHDNYTLFTGSTEGFQAADFDLGTPPLADLVRLFGHEEIFGDAKRITTIVPDGNTHRSTGVVFVATNQFRHSYYKLAGKRPVWYHKTINDSMGVDPMYNYGDSYTMVYHPPRDTLLILQHMNAYYYIEVDLKKRTWRQVQRKSFLDVLGFVPPITVFQGGRAKGVFSPFDGRIWLLVSFNQIYGIDLDSGDIVRAVHPGSQDGDTITHGGVSQNFNSRWYIAYVRHKHQLFLGQDYLGFYDLATNSFVPEPRNFGAGLYRWRTPPWSDPAGLQAGFGSGAATYCDYDRCVYLLIRSFDGTVRAGFFRYHVDKNYLELISESFEETPWPTSDAVLDAATPAYLGVRNTHALVYDSRRKRVYSITQRGVRAQIAYYDVIENKWVNTGEDAPVTSFRRWPDPDPTFAYTHTNFADFNPRTGSIYFAVGRGDTQGSYFYEYFPEEVEGTDLFDYTPATDGLPTASGVAKQFTTMSTVAAPHYSTSTALARDFYFSAGGTPAGTLRFTTTYGPEFTTISGNINSGTNVDTYELYIGTEPFDPHASFDLSAKLAFPQFSRAIFGGTQIGQCFFRLGLSDGVNRVWSAPQSTYGSQDLNLFQEIDIRVGVSGTTGSSATQFPFVAHIGYVDGFNANGGLNSNTDVMNTYDTYLSGGGINLGSQFSNFRDFRLSYTYETDMVEGFLDGVSMGSTKLRRKFNDNGMRVHFGFSARGNANAANQKFWIAQIKDLKITPKATDRIEGIRLLTAVSGTIGTYTHDRWDSTLVSGTDWVVEADTYLPKHFRFPGYDYIATLCGIGDGHKRAELAAFIGPGGQHMVGFTGAANDRDDFNSYVGFAPSRWDDLESSHYVIKRDTTTNTVGVYVNRQTEPAFVVDYDDLPSYNNQHMYYGKVRYGNWERVYSHPVAVSGTWITNPNYTGTGDPGVGLLCFSLNRLFATTAQGINARAEFTLDSDLGEVDLYCFHHSTNFDGARNVPYTVVSSGIVSAPTLVGDGRNVFSIQTNTDEFGAPDVNKTTLRIDQRRVLGGHLTNANNDLSEASGWIFIGRFRNPTKVIITANASVASASTQGFVCADAIAADLGHYGKSTFDMAVRRIRYRVGSTELPVDAPEASGISVIDLATNTVFNEYGENTAPELLDGDITSGKRID